MHKIRKVDRVEYTLVCRERHDSLRIAASGEVHTEAAAIITDTLPPALFLRTTPLTEADTALRQFATETCGAALNTTEQRQHALQRLMTAIYQRMRFQPGMTHVHTSAAHSFAQGHGVCQDYAHIFVACCRALRIPARYVGGYLFSANLQEAGHAWAEAWNDGWHCFDLTHNTPCHEEHVRVACGLDYRDASPITGIRAGGGTEIMQVQLQVQRVA